MGLLSLVLSRKVPQLSEDIRTGASPVILLEEDLQDVNHGINKRLLCATKSLFNHVHKK